MSKYFYLLCGLLLTLSSCGGSHSDKKGDDDGGSIKDAVSAVSSLSKMGKEAEKASKDYDALAHTTPLTNDQLKAWMPETLDGLQRSSYSVGGGGYMNISRLEATYSNEDKSEKLKLQVMDGADSLAAGAISLIRMTLAADFERQDENHVEKTETRNGIKAVLKYQKDTSRSSLEFVYDKRFSIELHGTHFPADDLWKAAGELNLKSLGK